MMSIFALVFLFSFSSGTNVPALIWSPNRPLSDLPDVFAGHAVSSADFHGRYLKPLASGDVSALVVFLQDRLSLDDFTHYADVYNPESTGGAFQNVKNFMDEQFSVQLPHVASPLAAIERVKKSYAGKVHKLEPPYDLNQLSLSADKGNLIVVHLPKIRVSTQEQSIANSDKVIGQVLSELTKRDVKYTAIYTAEASSQETGEAVKYSGRHLLETPSASAPGYNESLFVNGTCGFLYALTLKLVDKTASGINVANLTKATMPDTPCGNFSEPLVWTISFANPENTSLSEVILELNFTIRPNTQKMDWYIANAQLSYKGKFVANDTEEINTHEFNGEDIWAPRGMAYHCYVPDPIRQLNSTLTNPTLVFGNLQVQPFGVRNGKFGLPWDCVGFFTAPIWMALFSVLILLIILAYGLAMILNINVMDRFDDAKGKTIVINAQE